MKKLPTYQIIRILIFLVVVTGIFASLGLVSAIEVNEDGSRYYIAGTTNTVDVGYQTFFLPFYAATNLGWVTGEQDIDLHLSSFRNVQITPMSTSEVTLTVRCSPQMEILKIDKYDGNIDIRDGIALVNLSLRYQNSSAPPPIDNENLLSISNCPTLANVTMVYEEDFIVTGMPDDCNISWFFSREDNRMIHETCW